MLRKSTISRSTPLRFLQRQTRTRFLTLAVIVLILLNYLASIRQPKKSRYRIQAVFSAEPSDVKAVRLRRQEQVKDAFFHAWTGYKEHAWLHDEVMPLSGGHKDTFVGWAATLVDGLDTLYIMGLRKEFKDALKALEQIDFSKPNAERVPIFETTIQYLRGLLGAWDISGHKYPILRQKATELGEFLYRAFETESGIPVPYYRWMEHHDQKLAGQDGVLVAQIGSLSLEFIRLSQVTGDAKYANAVQKITDLLEQTQNDTDIPGMWPSKADYGGGNLTFSGRALTLGAFADSLFEYLPKTHLLLPSSNQYLDMYHMALPAFSKNLFFRPSLPGNPDILFPGYIGYAAAVPPILEYQVQHLGCFVGGMVGLGSRFNNFPQERWEELETAKKLTDGCVWAYSHTPSGIMPEVFHVNACPDRWPCAFKGEGFGFTSVEDPSYQLRPEAIESVFIMYRLTADPSWQDKGWKMFQNTMIHTKTKIANARLKNVMDGNPEKEDSMESFWLAETLKYYFLLFSDAEVVSLDDFVLNTEAHPFRLRNP